VVEICSRRAFASNHESKPRRLDFSVYINPDFSRSQTDPNAEEGPSVLAQSRPDLCDVMDCLSLRGCWLRAQGHGLAE